MRGYPKGSYPLEALVPVTVFLAEPELPSGRHSYVVPLGIQSIRVRGFAPPTSGPPDQRSTKLSYTLEFVSSFKGTQASPKVLTRYRREDSHLTPVIL